MKKAYILLTLLLSVSCGDNAPLDIIPDEDLAVKIMKAAEVTVFVDMHEGSEEATAWGCDLTYDYVKINADYRS